MLQLVHSLQASSLYSTRVSRGALLVPPLMQLVHSSHASNPYSTRVLLAHTTCTTVDAACAIFARLEPLLGPCALGAHNWYQLLYSFNRLCAHLVHTTCATDVAACALFAGLEPLLDPCLPGRTTRTAVDAACALFARPEPLLDSCAPGAHYLYHR